MNLSIRKILDTVNSESCPKNLNFHCHTLCSDGSLTPLNLFIQAFNLGIKHLAVTDHHNVDAYRQIIGSNLFQTKFNQNSFCTKLWPGIEISCLIKKCLVHIIGLDIDINHKSLSPYVQNMSTTGELLRAEHVIKTIHDAGGIAILAHPARYRINYKELIDDAFELGIDGAEAWYDYDFNEEWTPSLFVCEQIDSQLKSLGLLSSCGTDTHGLSLKGR